MATVVPTQEPTLEQLVQAVRGLSPEERREFLRRVGEGQEQDGEGGPDEAALRQAAKAKLPTLAARRLKRLVAKSERGQLSPQELADYQELARQAQQIDAVRAQAMAKLVRFQRKSDEPVKSARDQGGSNGS